MTKYEDLAQLARLLDEGKLSQEEFDRAKKELLGSDSSQESMPIRNPGWYSDPSGKLSHEAYWDGEKWSGDTRKLQGTLTADESTERHVSKGWLLGAAALMILGSFMPWAQAGIFSFSGTQGDGALTLIAGVIVGVIGLIRPSSAFPGVVAIVVSALSLLIVGNVFSNFVDTPESIGTGLVVAGLGSFVGVVGGVKVLEDARTKRT